MEVTLQVEKHEQPSTHNFPQLGELHLVPVCIVEFYLGVTHCEPGDAFGCMEFRNRGLDLAYEVTCWPKQKHGRFTTGEQQPFTFVPDPIQLNNTEKRMCAILGLDELDLATFLRSWEPAERPITKMGWQALLKYGDQTKECICKDCGHVWLACGKPPCCPNCDSAWWWNRSVEVAQ